MTTSVLRDPDAALLNCFDQQDAFLAEHRLREVSIGVTARHPNSSSEIMNRLGRLEEDFQGQFEGIKY